MAPYEKIDVHSHYVPPEYRRLSIENGHEFPDGMPGIPPWSEASHLEMMSTVNVTKAILSITSPGVHLVHDNNALARHLARHCNEFAADLKRRRPEQFGFWASLPLPDVEGTLEEIRYALDELDADGVCMMTNHHGVYLGDPRFDPVFKELNRRKAVIFIHPTTPCTQCAQPASVPPRSCLDDSAPPHQQAPDPAADAGDARNQPHRAVPLTYVPRSMFEFLFDTARCAINLFLSGTVSRNPDLTIILAHMGGVLPSLVARFSTIPTLLKIPGTDPLINPAYVKERLRRQFYFDTAGWALPDQIMGLLPYLRDAEGGAATRVVYGSDFPYTPLGGVRMLSEDHDRYLPEVFPAAEDRERICTGNAKRLLQRN